VRYSRDRAINDRVVELIRQGWTVSVGGKHCKIRHPNGYTTPVPGSPSDSRARQNFMAQIRRAERDGFRGGTITPGAPRREP
jgi:hypothetical protein